MTIRFQPLLRFSAVALSAALLSSCLLGPDHVQPAAPTVARISGKPLPTDTVSTPVNGGESQRFVEGGVLPARWWTQFGSPLLNGWVDEALANNPTLSSAQATLRQSEALYRAETGSYYPSVTAEAGATRNKTSGAAFGGGSVPGSIFNLYNASVNISYGLDFWGGTRRGVEAQGAALERQRWQTTAAYLTLTGNVVTSAVALASAETRLKTAQEILDGYTDTVRLVEKRLELGAGSRSDVIAVKAQQAQAAANVPPLEKQRISAANRLAILLGRYPSEFDTDKFDLTALQLPREIPVSLPSELVRRRPDIAAADATLHIAAANVGIATANQLPSLLLSGRFGTQASKPKNLFDESIWSIGANLSAPLFAGGTLRAQKKAAVAAYEAAQSDYRGVVLEAFRDVADALAALDIDARALAAQQSAFDLAQENAKLVELRFKTGSANVLEVRDARRSAGEAQIIYTAVLAARFADTAALFQALGGDGWDASTTAAKTPSASAP